MPRRAATIIEPMNIGALMFLRLIESRAVLKFAPFVTLRHAAMRASPFYGGCMITLSFSLAPLRRDAVITRADAVTPFITLCHDAQRPVSTRPEFLEESVPPPLLMRRAVVFSAMPPSRHCFIPSASRHRLLLRSPPLFFASFFFFFFSLFLHFPSISCL